MTATTLEQLSEALENTRGRTPREVLDAFCPVGAKIGSRRLVPLTAGHDLFLTRMKHPLARGAGAAWTAEDVALLLFAFTRPSSELFRLIEEDALPAALHEFLDELPLGETDGAATALVAHWIRSRHTAIGMAMPKGAGAEGVKKKRASGTGSR